MSELIASQTDASNRTKPNWYRIIDTLMRKADTEGWEADRIMHEIASIKEIARREDEEHKCPTCGRCRSRSAAVAKQSVML